MSAGHLDYVRAVAEAWPAAQAVWSPSTRLHAPTVHGAPDEPEAGVHTGVPGSALAWLDLSTMSVHVNTRVMADNGLGTRDCLAVLAHEVGHHVLAPADRTTAARVALRVRRALIDRDPLVPYVSNLWLDLVINDELAHRRDIDVTRVLAPDGPVEETNTVFATYLRCLELLGRRPAGSLVEPGQAAESEARIMARVARVYSKRLVKGAEGFAALIRPLLPPPDTAVTWLTCHGVVGEHRLPDGLVGDASLVAPVLHPVLDPEVMGTAAEHSCEAVEAPEPSGPTGQSGDGQRFEPADLHAVVTALGISVDKPTVTAHYYRELAAPHLVPFEDPRPHRYRETIPGASETWELGEDLADIDWAATVLASPLVVPGVTTRKRVQEEDRGGEPEHVPLDLDLYLDSSGSMPNPAHVLSPVAVAGTILALSALRAGGRVQATTWSGREQIASTDGFTRDTDAVMAAIVSSFRGATCFPLPLLERTHLGPRTGNEDRRRCHIAVVSDTGVVSMMDDVEDATGSPGVAERALEAAGGGGTLLLNCGEKALARLRLPAGYETVLVTTMDDVISRSRELSRRVWRRNR